MITLTAWQILILLAAGGLLAMGILLRLAERITVRHGGDGAGCLGALVAWTIVACGLCQLAGYNTPPNRGIGSQAIAAIGGHLGNPGS